MKRLIILFLLISLGDGVSRFELKEKEIELVLLKHNQLRRQEAYEMGAKDMIQTEWSKELALKAQQMAETCVEEVLEGPIYDRNYCSMKLIEECQDYWYSKKRYYIAKNSTCNAIEGVVCAQYLNLVKSKGHYIGCGRNYCKNIKGPNRNNAYLFVCYFDSVAKRISAESGKFYAPYTRKIKTCMRCGKNKYNYLTGLCEVK